MTYIQSLEVVCSSLMERCYGASMDILPFRGRLPKDW